MEKRKKSSMEKKKITKWRIERTDEKKVQYSKDEVKNRADGQKKSQYRKDEVKNRADGRTDERTDEQKKSTSL